MNLAAAMDDLLGLLQEAGVPATAEPRELDPPMVLVGVPQVTADALDPAAWAALFPVTVVAPAGDRPSVLAALSDLLDATMAALNVRTAVPNEWPNPAGGDPLPAYDLAAPARVTED